MKCTGIVLVISALVLAGCGSAPVETPRAASAFEPPERPPKGADGRPIPVLPSIEASDAASAFFDSALEKATSSDKASDFKMKADGLSIFSVTLAAGGALTGSKSKLYKAAGALLGLGMGANQYFKPKDQVGIYLNSAEAAYCSGMSMKTLSHQLDGIEHDAISQAEDGVRQLNIAIKSAVYSGKIPTNSPFQAAALVTAAMNSEADTAKQLAALNFIRTIQQQVHKRKLALLKYEINEINKTAYNIDDTLGTIAKLSVAPADAIKALTSQNNIDLNALTADKNVNQLLNRLPEIIQTVADFNACTDPLKNTPES